MFSCLSLHITYECKDVHVHTHSNVCIYICRYTSVNTCIQWIGCAGGFL